jgi:hypothetical protein
MWGSSGGPRPNRRLNSALFWTSHSKSVRSGADNRGGDKADHSATFFSDTNADAKAAREMLAEESLNSLIKWLKKEGNVGIMGECCVRNARTHVLRRTDAQTPPTARTSAERGSGTALLASPDCSSCSSSRCATTPR